MTDAPALGLARCALCRREVEFEQDPPTRCAAREGGCGASGTIRVKRLPRRRGTPAYDPERDHRERVERLGVLLERQGARARGEAV